MLNLFQKTLINILMASRNEESYMSGGSILNAETARISEDIDIFHNSKSTCNKYIELDISILKEHGYNISILKKIDGFAKILVSKNEENTEIDFAWESAFRFFPLTKSQEFGYILHPLDQITNKLLAMTSREAVRDYYDICSLIKQEQPVKECIWAMCAKDPGYTPYSTLDALCYGSIYTQDDFDTNIIVGTKNKITIQECKQLFNTMVRQAREIFQTLPQTEYGVLYLKKDKGQAFFPSKTDRDLNNFDINKGGLYGILPSINISNNID